MVSDRDATLTVDSLGKPGAGTGHGVPGMRERAESIGGSCSGRAWRRRLAGARVVPARGPGGSVMIKVLLVDDQELIRAGLRGILRPQFGFEIVGECPDGGAVRPLSPR